MAFRSTQPFLHSSQQHVPIFYDGLPLPPSKLPLPMGGSGLHIIHGPPQSSIQMASRSVQPFLQGSVTDRQTDQRTDRPRSSICNNRPHLASAVMWRNNTSNNKNNINNNNNKNKLMLLTIPLSYL